MSSATHFDSVLNLSQEHVSTKRQSRYTQQDKNGYHTARQMPRFFDFGPSKSKDGEILLQTSEHSPVLRTQPLGSIKVNDNQWSELMFQINNVLEEIQQVDIAKNNNSFSKSQDEFFDSQQTIDSLNYRLQFRDQKIHQLVVVAKKLLKGVQESTSEACGLREKLTQTIRDADENSLSTQILNSEIHQLQKQLSQSESDLSQALKKQMELRERVEVVKQINDNLVLESNKPEETKVEASNDCELLSKRVKELQDLNLSMYGEYQKELRCLQSVNKELDDRCIEYKEEIFEKNSIFQIEVAELKSFLAKKDEEINSLKRSLRYINEQNLQKEDMIRDLEIRANILEEQLVQENKSQAPLNEFEVLRSNYSQNQEHEQYSQIDRQRSPIGLYENAVSYAKKSEIDINKSFLHQDSFFKEADGPNEEDSDGSRPMDRSMLRLQRYVSNSNNGRPMNFKSRYASQSGIQPMSAKNSNSKASAQMMDEKHFSFKSRVMSYANMSFTDQEEKQSNFEQRLAKVGPMKSPKLALFPKLNLSQIQPPLDRQSSRHSRYDVEKSFNQSFSRSHHGDQLPPTARFNRLSPQLQASSFQKKQEQKSQVRASSFQKQEQKKVVVQRMFYNPFMYPLLKQQIAAANELGEINLKNQKIKKNEDVKRFESPISAHKLRISTEQQSDDGKKQGGLQSDTTNTAAVTQHQQQHHHVAPQSDIAIIRFGQFSRRFLPIIKVEQEVVAAVGGSQHASLSVSREDDLPKA